MTNDTLLSASLIGSSPGPCYSARPLLVDVPTLLTVSVATALWKQAKLAMTPTPTQKMAVCTVEADYVCDGFLRV